MKRFFLALMGLFFAVVVVGACGAGDDGEGDPAASDTREALDEGAGALRKKPITSDLVATTEVEKFLPDDNVGDYFGNAVAVSGNTAIVGAPFDSDRASAAGAAYIFVWNGASWAPQAKLTASNGLPSDQFGTAVAIDGDTAVVGAPTHNGTETDTGAAYVFVRVGTTWTQQAILTANDEWELDFLGGSVAISGDTALVSARGDDDKGSGAGAAYIFVRNGALWSQQTKLVAADGSAGDTLGQSVSIVGDTALVGAGGDDDKGIDSGSAYVFVRSGVTWSQQTKLVAADGEADDHFGSSVSFSGNTALVGAPFDNDKGTDSGSAYFFLRSGATFTQQAKITASDGVAFDNFGDSVQISGTTAILGAPFDDANATDSGSAYIFIFNGATWVGQKKIFDGAGGFNDRYGFSVALAGNTALAGAPFDDDKGSRAGSAFLWALSGATWTFQSKITAPDDGAATDDFGSDVAISGDTAIVGAWADDDKGADSGSAYVFAYAAGKWARQAKLFASDEAAGDALGYSVAISADTVIVGAPGHGAAYVFVRQGSSFVQQAKLLSLDGAAGDGFGQSVSISGDTAIIGAPNHKAKGAAYVFVRNGSSWTQQTPLSAAVGALGDQFGCSVSLSGDTALIGAVWDDDHGVNSGSAYVFVRNGATFTQQAKLSAVDGTPNAQFGISVSFYGDTALVGARYDDQKGSNAGAAYVFVRSGGAFTQQAKLTADDASAFEEFASSVSLFGDTALVGALFDDQNATNTGSAYVFVRHGSSWIQEGKAIAADWGAHDSFGSAVAMDADKALIASWQDDDKGTNSGSASIVSVRRSLGLPCASASQCEAGNCVDGFCCDTPCNGPCQACAAALKSAGVDGFCGNVAEGTDPHDSCMDVHSVDPKGCGNDGTCTASGACRVYAYGTSCGADECVGEAVQSKICNGFGACTSDPLLEQCELYHCVTGACKASCASDADCIVGAFCDAATSTCQADSALGAACITPAQCKSGLCVAGVCCNAPCNGTCEACTAAKKGAGLDGFCGPVAEGTDPYDSCMDVRDVEPKGCGTDGFCGSGGVCRIYEYGKSCGADECVGEAVQSKICNGFGACTPDPILDECGDYHCEAGACKSNCTTDADCAEISHCDTATGTCLHDDLLGAACEVAAQCASGFCVDGVCCDSACAGDCRFCDQDGVCRNADDGTDPRDKCQDDGPSSCKQDGACNGAGLCRLYPYGDTCGAAVCLGDLRYGQQICNGLGACAPDPSALESCLPYACVVEGADGACKAACAADTDCADGFSCSHEKCVPAAAFCLDEDTSLGTDGTKAECAPYRCAKDSGECLRICSSVDDCIAPNVCDTTKTCVPPVVAEVEAGCGCRVPGKTGDGSGAAAAFLAAAVMIWRNGRRRFGVSILVAIVVLATAACGVSGELSPNPATEAPSKGAMASQKKNPLADLVTTKAVAKLLPRSIGFNSKMGDAVAIDGNTVVVGVPYDQDGGWAAGAVYVFEWDGLAWTKQAKLRPTDSAAEMQFGLAVAVSGDTVIIGARESAYVFVRVGGSFSQHQKLTVQFACPYFGRSVALSGDTAVVGCFFGVAMFGRTGSNFVLEAGFTGGVGGDVAVSGNTVLAASSPNNVVGSAYVFIRNGTTWLVQAQLLPSDGASPGSQVPTAAIDGDTAILGLGGANNGFGSAYVFVRNGQSWAEEAKLTATNGSSYDFFGSSVALSGDVALVSSPNDDESGQDRGAVYVFGRSGPLWSKQAKLFAADGAVQDEFGGSVALSGANAIVGAPGDDDPSSDSGSAYVFLRNGSNWVEQEKLRAGGGVEGDGFGSSVSVFGETALIGAPGDNDRGSGAGAAYVFVWNGTTWIQQAKLEAADGAESESFGAAVVLVGDTAIIGAPYEDSAAYEAGAAYVFVRNGESWVQQGKLVAGDASFFDNFGASVALSGDTALVGAINVDLAGAVYVFVRNGGSWEQQAKLQDPAAAYQGSFGASVALSGETALVGAPDNGGRAHVFTRSGSDWMMQQTWFPEADMKFSAFGASVALSGETALVGGDRETSVFVRSGMNFEFQAKFEPGGSGSIFSAGTSVALSGDMALVGVPYDPGNGPSAGAAYVFIRDGATWSQQAKILAGNGVTTSKFGRAVAITGDLSRILVGSDDNEKGGSAGAAFVLSVIRGNGVPCFDGLECESSFCVDGYCCNTPCDGTCQACAKSLQLSGKDGFCGPSADGTDPHDSCEDSRAADPNSCGTDGFCGAGGVCRIYTYGTTCAADECVGEAVRSKVCNGFGTCTPDPILVACGDYQCEAGLCKSTCTTDADCAENAYCDAASGACLPDEPLGAACSSASQCQADHCAGGTCCSSECVANPDEPCGYTGTCSQFGFCELAPYGQTCGQALCNGGLKYGGQTCNGLGACVPNPSTLETCFPYVCDDNVNCKASCVEYADDAGLSDCVEGFFCRAGQCVPITKTCVSVDDCKTGEVCDAITKQCVPASAPLPIQDGACDCRVPGKTSGTSAAPLLAAALFALRRRTKGRNLR